jgi:hypothetical protein
MKILDITHDGTRKLVTSDEHTFSHYEPHDGSPVDLDPVLPVYLRQHHFVAAVKAGGADKNGLVLGPIENPNPAKWQILGRADAA